MPAAQDSAEVEGNIRALIKTYTGSRVYQEVKQRVADVEANPGRCAERQAGQRAPACLV